MVSWPIDVVYFDPENLLCCIHRQAPNQLCFDPLIQIGTKCTGIQVRNLPFRGGYCVHVAQDSRPFALLLPFCLIFLFAINFLFLKLLLLQYFENIFKMAHKFTTKLAMDCLHYGRDWKRKGEGVQLQECAPLLQLEDEATTQVYVRFATLHSSEHFHSPKCPILNCLACLKALDTFGNCQRPGVDFTKS